MNLVVCSITQKNDVIDTVLWRSLQKMGDIEAKISLGNTEKGLCEYYNECIDLYMHKDAIVFVHDDVDIINKDLVYQVQQGLSRYDVIGVAGCINPKIIDRNLWHWMAGDVSNCRGIAGHPTSIDSFHVTSFGPTPSRVAIIDGVLMAINVHNIIESGARFDEQFMFHHYDIDFSLTCNKKGLRIGVWPILINHQSPGLKEFDDKWNISNQKFITKWKNK